MITTLKPLLPLRSPSTGKPIPYVTKDYSDIRTGAFKRHADDLAEASANRLEVVYASKSKLSADLSNALNRAYGFKGTHEGNRWMIELDGPYKNIRDAIDGTMKSENPHA
jgi:hypothetical protein